MSVRQPSSASPTATATSASASATATSAATSRPATLPATLGALRAHGGFPARSVRSEMREHLVEHLRHPSGRLFPGLIGYDDTVIPQVINAILAGHDILLLGLRGQAKTRLARGLTRLLDDFTPALSGDPLRSHPLAPVGAVAEELIAKNGDATAVEWLTAAERYGEKLATPDVSVADLIGDIDPIRAQREGLDLGDLRTVTFGIVPRSNRGIFCINELPDLAPRIQVALFNILEESDVQVRGIPLRLPLDVMLVFTANPEDYTARGQIITPLKDRIGSQILTHYPKTRAEGLSVMRQEALTHPEPSCVPVLSPLLSELIEEAARHARVSSLVDQASGVSTRLTISSLEAVYANVLARGLRNGEAAPLGRLVDLPAILPAMTGKLELAYEGEQEGPTKVGWEVLTEAMRTIWAEAKLPAPVSEDNDEQDQGPWPELLRWFAAGNQVILDDRCADKEHQARLSAVPGLSALAKRLLPTWELTLASEFIVDGLYAGGALARVDSARGLTYSDLLATMMGRSARKKSR